MKFDLVTKGIWRRIFFLALFVAILASGCTKKFEEINTGQFIGDGFLVTYELSWPRGAARQPGGC